MAGKCCKICLDVIVFLVEWVFTLWEEAFQSPLVVALMLLPSEGFTQKRFTFTGVFYCITKFGYQPLQICPSCTQRA